MTAVQSVFFNCSDDCDKRSIGVIHFKFDAEIDHKHNYTLRTKCCFYVNNYKDSDNLRILITSYKLTLNRFWHSEDRASWYILIIKDNKKHYFSQLYFGKELYIFRIYLLSIIRSLNTVYTAIGICHSSYVDCLLASSGWNFPKHVEFFTKINLRNSASCWLLLQELNRLCTKQRVLTKMKNCKKVLIVMERSEVEWNLCAVRIPSLTLILLMWRIGWAHNNARK